MDSVHSVGIVHMCLQLCACVFTGVSWWVSGTGCDGSRYGLDRVLGFIMLRVVFPGLVPGDCDRVLLGSSDWAQ